MANRLQRNEPDYSRSSSERRTGSGFLAREVNDNSEASRRIMTQNQQSMMALAQEIAGSNASIQSLQEETKNWLGAGCY